MPEEATGVQHVGLLGRPQIVSMVDYREGSMCSALCIIGEVQVFCVVHYRGPQVFSEVDYRGAPSVQGGGLQRFPVI